MTRHGKVAQDFEAMLAGEREKKRLQSITQHMLGSEKRKRASISSSSPFDSAASHRAPGSMAARAGVKKPQQRASTGSDFGVHRSLSARIAAPGTRKAEKIADAVKRNQFASNSTPFGSPAPAAPAFGSPAAPPDNAPRGPFQSGFPAHVPRGPKTKQSNSPWQSAPTSAPQRGTSAAAADGLFDPPPVLPALSQGISIRGIAGPFVVAADNFAPGTTAADIESAVSPVGGAVQNCIIVRHRPSILAEILFESREGAERVIKFFNGKTADSRILHFYPKVGNSAEEAFTQPQPKLPPPPPQVVDGSHGFEEPRQLDVPLVAATHREDVEMANSNDYNEFDYSNSAGTGVNATNPVFAVDQPQPTTRTSNGNDKSPSGLYSDRMVSSTTTGSRANGHHVGRRNGPSGNGSGSTGTGRYGGGSSWRPPPSHGSGSRRYGNSGSGGGGNSSGGGGGGGGGGVGGGGYYSNGRSGY